MPNFKLQCLNHNHNNKNSNYNINHNYLSPKLLFNNHIFINNNLLNNLIMYHYLNHLQK